MSRTSSNRRAGPWRAWTAVAMGLTALAVIPVGSGAPAARDASPAAQSLVKQAMAPSTRWIGPTSAPALVKGKTIGVIPCATFVEGCAREERGVVEAAKAAGWKTIVIDGKVDPQVQQKAMNSLIANKVDAIVLNSINASSVGQGMAAAKKAGIPVIVSFAQDPQPFGGIADVRIDDTNAGKVAAAYIVTHGGGNVLAVYDNSAEEVVQRYDGLKAGLSQFGGGKLLASEKISGSQIGPSEATLMSSYLQRYKKGDINWVFCGYDFMCTPLIQEIDRSGRNEIKAIGYDGNLENLAFIRKGTVQQAAIGYPLEWAGWAVVDELNRPANDVLRIAVVERHTGSGRIGRAFVSGLGLRDGAVAMTYCHVHQNLLVIGTSDDQMARAAGAVAARGGGMAVVHGDRVAKSLTLPVGGVLASTGLRETADEMHEIEEAIRALGNVFDSPILSIAFCALPTIPAYGLTDLGLYDVGAEEFVDVVLEHSR